VTSAVEVTQAKCAGTSGAHRSGQPCSHVWFLQRLPSRIGHLLDIPLRELEKFSTSNRTLSSIPATSPVKERELLSDDAIASWCAIIPASFVAKMGAEAIKELLAAVQIEELATELRKKMREETSQQKKLKYSKRLKGSDEFFEVGEFVPSG